MPIEVPIDMKVLESKVEVKAARLGCGGHRWMPVYLTLSIQSFITPCGALAGTPTFSECQLCARHWARGITHFSFIPDTIP